MEKEDDRYKGEGAAKSRYLETPSTVLRTENNFQVFKGLP